MLTKVEIIANRQKLVETRRLICEVRASFAAAGFTHGAATTNNILVLIADLLKDLSLLETMLRAKP